MQWRDGTARVDFETVSPCSSSGLQEARPPGVQLHTFLFLQLPPSPSHFLTSPNPPLFNLLLVSPLPTWRVDDLSKGPFHLAFLLIHGVAHALPAPRSESLPAVLPADICLPSKVHLNLG